MLLRNLQSSVFHIICRETVDKKYFVGLCGQKVEKGCLELQSVADGAYSRCWRCQKIDHAKIRKKYRPYQKRKP